VSILQRYVLREILAPLGMGLAVFTFVILIGRIFQLTDILLNSSVPGHLAGELIALLLPSIFSITIPMAVLVAILLGIGRLAADREILAIRTTGISLWHICVPVLLLATALAGAMMYANRTIIPYLNTRSSDVRMQLEFYVLSAIPQGIPFELPSQGKGGDTSFFFDHKGEDGSMQDVLMQMEFESAPGATPADAASSQTVKTKQGAGAGKKAKAAAAKTTAGKPAAAKSTPIAASAKDLAHKKAEARREKERLEIQLAENRKANEALVVARSARIVPDIAQRVLNFELTSGSIHFSNPAQPTSYDVVRFDQMIKGYVPSFARTEEGYYVKKTSEMSNAELLESRREQGRLKGARFAVEYYQRFSIPLACIAFALIAIPLAVYVRPTGKAIAFAMSFLLILLYYGLQQYGVAIAKSGSSIGVFSIFLPNILLMAAGSVLLYRMVMR
jgi:lipopolysaccharide export system permease protein